MRSRLSRMVEGNYRLDLRERTLSLYRRIFGWEQRRLVCSFSGIECVALDTRSELRKDGKRRRLEHRHGLAIVLKNGKVLTAIDNSYIVVEVIRMHGQSLADYLGVRFDSDPGKLKVRRRGGQVQISRKMPSTTTAGDRIGGCCITIVLLFYGAAAVAKFVRGDVDTPLPATRATATPSPRPGTLPADPKSEVDLDVQLMVDGSEAKAVIANLGKKPITQDVGVLIESQGKRVATKTLKGPLRPSEARNVKLPSGHKALTVTVDPRNVVKETNEANNVLKI